MCKSMRLKEFQRYLEQSGFARIPGDTSGHLKYQHVRSGLIMGVPNHPNKDVNKAYIKLATRLANKS